MSNQYTDAQKIAFVVSIYPSAKTIADQYEFSVDLIIAQAIQETGWGEKVLQSNTVYSYT